MKISLGADHAGYELKERLRRYLEQAGHQVHDLGTDSADSTDYPDYAAAVAREVAGGAVDKGLLVCGSGTGMAIAANKIAGVRAANAHSADEARLARAHNDINVLALGARLLAEGAPEEILDTFLATPFDGGRHALRVGKINQLD